MMMMMTLHRVYTTHGLGLLWAYSRGTLETVICYMSIFAILSHTVDIPTLQCSYVREPFFWCTLFSTLRWSLTLQKSFS
jgi:hypothetical protein